MKKSKRLRASADNKPQHMKIILDNKQKEIDSICKVIATKIKPNNALTKIANFFNGEIPISGIYLYGGVGGGKTVIMHRFYEYVSVAKSIVHFQKFMNEIHGRVHALRKESDDEIIKGLASEIAQKSQLICIDEFEIKDITDAMIIMRLFEYLGKNGIFIFLTSNIIPDDLYQDGLQRSSFLPFIEMLNSKFKILHLNNEIDYRYRIISHMKRRIFFPINKENTVKINKIKNDICDLEEMSNIDIKLFGREISFKNAHQNILFTDFSELFERDLGYADYVAICENFNIIIVNSVRKILEAETNIITRFINFVDNAYFYKISLFMEIECAPGDIYSKNTKSKEFERTVSRLNEMNNIS